MHPNIHYHVHNNPPHAYIMSQIKSLRAVSSFYFKV